MVVVIVSLGLPAAASADVVVADGDAFGGGGGLIRVDSATGARTTVSENSSPSGGPAFVDPIDVTRAPNGDMLVVDSNAFGGLGGVIRVNPVTGARTTVSENSSPSGGPGFVDPFGITLAANGDVLGSRTRTPSVWRGRDPGRPGAGARTTAPGRRSAGRPRLDTPWGIVTLANGDILVADAGASRRRGVISVNPVTGARTTLSANGAPAGGPNFSDPIQLALAANGDVLVTDSSAFGGTGGVIRVDPVTGARTTVSENTSPPGDPTFAGPIGIRSAANGDILVAGFTNAGPDGGITRVDPLTGARKTVSVNTSPTGGPSFVFPSGVLVEPEPDTVAPETTITGGPSGRTEDHTPTFSFTSSEPGSLFACSADGVPLLLCSSPFTTLPLSPARTASRWPRPMLPGTPIRRPLDATSAFSPTWRTCRRPSWDVR